MAALDAEQRALEPEVAQAEADCNAAADSKDHEDAASSKSKGGASRARGGGALCNVQASLRPADREYQCILPAYMLERLT